MNCARKIAVAEDSSIPYLDAAAVARLMAHPLLARFPMEGSVSGHHKSPHRGSSVEFAEYRNYVPGDDIRRLDWRVFGRTDRFYLKEFEAETNLRACFILDSSASMNFQGAGETKLQYACRLIAHLVYLVIHQGDAAGLVRVGEEVIREIPPRRNPSHVQVILNALKESDAKGETGLISALHEFAEKIRRRALVLIFSDLFRDPEELISCFQHLRYQKHDVVVFHLLDRQELDFQFDRPVRFEDMESSFTLVTEPALIKQEYQRQLQLYLDRVKKGCHEFQIDYRQVTTDQPFERVLADFLIERARQAAWSRS